MKPTEELLIYSQLEKNTYMFLRNDENSLKFLLDYASEIYSLLYIPEYGYDKKDSFGYVELWIGARNKVYKIWLPVAISKETFLQILGIICGAPVHSYSYIRAFRCDPIEEYKKELYRKEKARFDCD